MGSRDKDPTTLHHHHQPLLSSLVVRASETDTDGGGGSGGRGGGGSGGRGGGGDYEPGEVRRDPLPYSRSDRYSDDAGYKTRARTRSPLRRRDAGHRYGSDFDHSGAPPRGRNFSGGRDPSGRYRDSSPPYGRGRASGRSFGRALDGPGYSRGPIRSDGIGRNNNPNVQLREGDWFCNDPACNNLNFARREYCNNCKRSRHAPAASPRRGYPGPPPPPRRFPGPPLDVSRGRMNGYRSPPRAWAQDGPRDLGPSGPPPPPRYEGRFSDQNIQRDRLDYPEDRGRSKFDKPVSNSWAHRDRGGRDNFLNDRRPLSPPPLPPASFAPRGRWRSPPQRDLRERSRSPIRGGPPLPPKEFRDMYVERGRDDRHALGRNRVGDAY